MKLRHLLYAAAAVLPLLFSCENKEKPLLPTVTVEPAFVTLEAGASVQTVTIQAGRGWVVYAKPDWVDAVNPESGKASETGESVTFSVKSNAGNDREGYIVFSTGLARAAFKITQKGEAGELTPGSGTLEDPYSVAGALAVAKPLTYTSTTDYQKIEGVYIKGKISTVTQNYTYNVTNGNTYGNARFNISDSGTAADEFICYNIYYLGNKKFVAGQTDIKVGDDVIVFGNIMNFKGNTPEFESGKCYLYSLNGTSEGGGGGQEQTDITDATVAQFIQSDGNTYYRLTGTVSNFTTGHNDKGNYDYMQFNLTDATGTVLVYGFKDRDGSYTQWATKIKNGGTVVLTGTYEYYQAKDQHEVMNTTIESFTEGTVVTVEGTVSDAVAAADNSAIKLKDGIVAATTAKGFVVTDGTSNCYAYVNGNPPAEIGDKVTFKATKTTYYGLPELTDITDVSVTSSGNNVPRTTLTDITATLDNFTSSKADYITLTGKMVKSGTYYNITVTGKEWMGSASLPNATISAQMDALDGRDVKVTGYFNTVNTGKKIVNIIVTEVVAASEYYCYPDNTNIKVKADVTSAEIKISANSAWTLTSREGVTLSNATGTAGSEVSGSADATVTATFPANESTEADKVYSLVLVCAAEYVNEPITITQSKVVEAGSGSYVLDGSAISKAHSEAWAYTSGEKKITATDGSVWTCFNTYANKNQVTVQMNKGKSAYVLTPELPSGKEIKTISVVLNKKADGTGDMGDRPMDILSADGTATLLDNVTGQTLADGMAVAAGHSQVRVICDETGGGAVYIKSITVTF